MSRVIDTRGPREQGTHRHERTRPGPRWPTRLLRMKPCNSRCKRRPFTRSHVIFIDRPVPGMQRGFASFRRCARLILLGSPLKSPADNQATRQPSAVEMRRARARQLISCNLSKWPLAFYMCTRPPVAPCSVVKPCSS